MTGAVLSIGYAVIGCLVVGPLVARDVARTQAEYDRGDYQEPRWGVVGVMAILGWFAGALLWPLAALLFLIETVTRKVMS